MRIYRGILDGLTDPEDRQATLHNLATLEARADDRQSAMTHWREAYRLNPNDEEVRAGFISALVRWDNYDLALKVSQGQPLDDPTPPQP